MRSIDRLKEFYAVDIASGKIPQSKLDALMKRHDWLLRPDEERPQWITWDFMQSQWDIGKNSGYKLFIYNEGVKNPEFVDDDGNMRVATINGSPQESDRRYVEAILGRIFQIIEPTYQLNKQYQQPRWDALKDKIFLPTADQMEDMLLNGGEIEISFTTNLDVRTDDAKKKERKVNQDVHVDPDDADLISDAVRAHLDQYNPTEEKHVYMLKVGRTDLEAFEDQYSWHLITQPWNPYATPKGEQSSLVTKFKAKFAKPNANSVPEDSTECEKGGSHEWVTSLAPDTQVDDGKSLQVCRKCRKYAV